MGHILNSGVRVGLTERGHVSKLEKGREGNSESWRDKNGSAKPSGGSLPGTFQQQREDQRGQSRAAGHHAEGLPCRAFAFCSE